MKMCRLSTIWGTIFAMLMLVCGCTAEPFDEYGVGDEVLVSFQPTLDLDITTRAISDGGSINQLVVVAYEDGNEVLRQAMPWSVTENKSVTLRLIYGRTYDIIFWAQHADEEENGVYEILEDGVVTIKDIERYRSSDFTGMEQYDAFYCKKNVTVGSQNDSGAELTRLLGQVNFGSEVQPDATFPCTVTFTDMATSYNLLTGEAVEDSKATTTTFTYTKFPNETLSAKGQAYYYVASAYLFPATVKVEYALGEVKHSFENVAVGANKRINILGDIVTQPATEDTWDGTTVTDLEPNADGDYIISTCAELVGLGQITPPLTGNVFIVNDLNFNDKDVPSLHNLSGVTIDGGEEGHTIKNLNLSEALFGDATNLTVENLTIEGVTITNNATHVGALVNTLTGGGSFTNVTVTGANVTTTNGAAGGIVGYIVRESEKDRNEKLAAAFNGCKLENVIVDGTRSEGHFVGLLSGYDRGESLTFDSGCSVTSTQTLSSYYAEGNECEWLKGNNYGSYNSWLGDEEYCRGTVQFNGIQFIPKWNGSRTVEPLKINNEDNKYEIYSAFDLAYMQGKTLTRVNFKENIDLGGVRRENEYVDKTKGINPFTPIGSIKYLDGENHTLYNLYVEVDDMGGFIASAAGESTHENLTFENSAVVVHFVTLNEGTDKAEDRGYAGTLTPVVWSGTNYVVSNIKVSNSYVFGLGKIGGLIGYIDSGTTGSTIKDCTVTGTTVKNEKGKTQELFEQSKAGATVSMKFYAQGEAGGLIGMLMGNSDIDNCHVTNSTMDCYGEANQSQWVKVGGIIPVRVTVQGRHVNNFIGDIRTAGYWIGNTQYTNVVTIDGCTATNNTYITTDGKRKDDPFKNGSKSTNLVGEPYYLNVYNIAQIDPKGSVKIDGKEFL